MNPSGAVPNRRHDETDVRAVYLDNLRVRYVQLLQELSFFPLFVPFTARFGDVPFHCGAKDVVKIGRISESCVPQFHIAKAAG
jgi:hypothetical protein